ncbi:MAG TPA: hypothetical protein VLJ68_03155, partial [Chitinophagaceae bacterium]|nr:hypothetical protein [Chitinophagaceae bacterium]
SDSLLMTIKGKYTKGNDVVYPSPASVLPMAQQPEVFRRIGLMHNLLLEAYPQPLGLEAKWFGKLSNGTFADDVNFSHGILVWMYFYSCTFLSYTCVQNKPNEVAPLADVYDHFNVFVNQIGALQNDFKLDTMTINSRKVYMLNPVVGSWKGYDLYGSPGEGFRAILLKRKGESPITPVTRKEYLEYCFRYFNIFFENQAKPMREMADRQLRDELINKVNGMKEDVIKRYQAEWKTSSDANLLDSPAEIYSPFTITEGTPIFASGPDGGKMLVTENPAYIKKDLPKYAPQFMVLYWKWTSDFPMYGGEQGVYFKKTLEAHFPIEKLQAMIDK